MTLVLSVSVGHSVQTVGRWYIGPRLASGGMAALHLGLWRGGAGITRIVAIKRLHDALAGDADHVAMLMDEARIAARVRHTSLVAVLDVVSLPPSSSSPDHDVEDDFVGRAPVPALVLEYVHGPSLALLLTQMRERAARAPLSVSLAILDDVLRGLDVLHHARSVAGAPLGVVHRDVSPQNVLVGDDGVARLIDLGVAFAQARAQTTKHGEIKGKPSYFAPEQARGGKVDARTDLFAAGLVLFELVSGTRLVHRDDALDVESIVNDWFAEPWGVDGAPAPLVDALKRAFAIDPSARFNSAIEMASVLSQIGPRATPIEVAEWVSSNARAWLDERGTELETFERFVVAREESATTKVVATTRARGGHEDASPALLEPSSRSAKTGGRGSLFASGALAGALLAVLALYSMQRFFTSRPGELESSMVPDRERISNLAATVPIASASSSELSRAAASANILPAVALTATAPSRSAEQVIANVVPVASSVRLPARGSNPNCTPPYRVDAEGVRTFKPECL